MLANLCSISSGTWYAKTSEPKNLRRGTPGSRRRPPAVVGPGSGCPSRSASGSRPSRTATVTVVTAGLGPRRGRPTVQSASSESSAGPSPSRRRVVISLVRSLARRSLTVTVGPRPQSELLGPRQSSSAAATVTARSDGHGRRRGPRRRSRRSSSAAHGPSHGPITARASPVGQRPHCRGGTVALAVTVAGRCH